MPVELKIPSAGESITAVQIGAWTKAVGDVVERDEILVEIETDKASMELPAPAAGRIARILKRAGESAAVGEVIAVIDESAAVAASISVPATDGRRAARADASAAGQPPPEAELRVMPAARHALAKHGLSAQQVEATGPGGRLLKEDVLRHAAAELRTPRSSDTPAATPRPATGGIHPAGPRDEDVVPMTLLRKRIAERLVQAQQTAAMLTTFNEIDMSAVMALRSQHKEPFEKRYGVKLGFMSFFVKAAIDALKAIPALNAEIRGENIVYRNYYDIGVAVSTDRGLVVPVLRNAERLSFAEVEKAIADFGARARDRKIAPEELQGGTFTISNGGVFGSLMSTPILNPPQSGILGLHAIQDRPVVREGQVVIRPMMYVALTYDHRIVDGREAVTFLKRIKECTEEPARMLLEA